MVPAIAYQLANGARSVWAVPQPTLEQLQNRAYDRFYRDAAAFCSQWGSVKWEHHNLCKVRYIIVSAGILTASTTIGPLRSASRGRLL